MNNESKVKRQLLDDHMIKKFNTDMGINATVKRETKGNSDFKNANLKLRSIGSKMGTREFKGYTYIGSAAVHIYQSEILGELGFASQVDTLQDTVEILADKALTALKSDMMNFYGRDRQKKRSGF